MPSTVFGRQLNDDRPPGPTGSWLEGNLGAYERDRLGFLSRAAHDYGDIVSFDRRTTIVNGPDLVRSVLGDTRTFRTTENFLQEPTHATGVGSAAASRWLTTSLRPALAGAIMPVTRDALRGVWSGVVGRGPLDPVPALERVTSTAIARHYFGEDGDALPGPAAHLLDALSEVVGNPFALPSALRSPARRRIARRFDAVRSVVMPLLLERQARPRLYLDVAGDMVARHEGQPNVILDQVCNVLIGSMLAAHRVPAAAAGWMLHLMSSSPPALTGLREEADRFDAMMRSGSCQCRPQHFPAALAIVMESLRLYPPTWLISRRTTAPVVVGDYRLPARHNVLMSPYVLHRHEATYARPEEFLPDRWITECRPPHSYLPFGSGPRACPGSNVALGMLVAILLSLLSEYDIADATVSVSADPRTTLLPVGLRMRFDQDPLLDRRSPRPPV